ncbi:MAG: 4-hydroxy-tetrahydrodipicolinate synthase [Candidatus Helarchaeota archaeon]|nr:4-hydroxy-tetrahydrodipicolinate synthase [Candidatus Helarchaeota archaeon]
MLKLEGSFVALITPMKKDREIDEESVRKFVDFHIEQGTHGLVPCGTTGESATMNHAEHKRMIDIVIDQTNGRVPVVAGTGSNSTKEALNLTKHAENAGADGALIISPYYNKPTQRGLIHHFTTLANETNIPIVLYNVPSRTGRNVEASTTLELAKHKNVVAIKEASGNIGQIMNILAGAPSGFVVVSGDDSLTYSLCTLGGTGVISVAANVAPKLMSTFMNNLIQGNYKKAREDHFKLLPLFKVLFVETNPGPCKKAAQLMKLAGIENWNLRSPLVEPTPENTEKIKVVLKDLKLL